MYRFLFPIIIIFSIAFTQTDGEVVKNVTAAQRTDGSRLVDIYYDLEDDYNSYSVYVTADWPGMYHNFPLYNCQGDVWENIIPGEGKQITCQLATPGDDETEYLSGDFFVNVHAEGHAVSELPDSFEMVEVNTDNTTLADRNYEMMKYEVTTSQYVEFLNDKLSQATNIIYNDLDGWPEQEGGETYNRIYEYEDGTKIQVYYANPGGCSNWYPSYSFCGDYVPNDGYGIGWIDGYVDDMSFRPSLSNNGYDNNNYALHLGNGHGRWLNLNQTSQEANHPLIQFSSTNICTSDDNNCEDNFSFFISEGKANHPIVNISIDGADAFADHYGLRIPSITEHYIPFLGTTVNIGIDHILDDVTLPIFLNLDISQLGYVCDYVLSDECGFEYTTYPVGTGIEQNGMHDIFGNVSEYVFIRNDYDVDINDSDGNGYPYYYENRHHLFGGSYYGFSVMVNLVNYNLTHAGSGFRCVRTLSY